MLQWENRFQGDLVSVASEQWRQDLRKPLTDYVRYLAEKWGDHIRGHHPCAQNAYSEWLYPIWGAPEGHGSGLMNFSTVFAQAFRRWLKDKYKSVQRLAEAWGQPLSS